jgi:hypothetical protein
VKAILDNWWVGGMTERGTPSELPNIFPDYIEIVTVSPETDIEIVTVSPETDIETVTVSPETDIETVTVSPETDIINNAEAAKEAVSEY